MRLFLQQVLRLRERHVQRYRPQDYEMRITHPSLMPSASEQDRVLVQFAPDRHANIVSYPEWRTLCQELDRSRHQVNVDVAVNLQMAQQIEQQIDQQLETQVSSFLGSSLKLVPKIRAAASYTEKSIVDRVKTSQFPLLMLPPQDQLNVRFSAFVQEQRLVFSPELLLILAAPPSSELPSSFPLLCVLPDALNTDRDWLMELPPATCPLYQIYHEDTGNVVWITPSDFHRRVVLAELSPRSDTFTELISLHQLEPDNPAVLGRIRMLLLLHLLTQTHLPTLNYLLDKFLPPSLPAFYDKTLMQVLMALFFHKIVVHVRPGVVSTNRWMSQIISKK